MHSFILGALIIGTINYSSQKKLFSGVQVKFAVIIKKTLTNAFFGLFHDFTHVTDNNESLPAKLEYKVSFPPKLQF